jgi:hypothetical protein
LFGDDSLLSDSSFFGSLSILVLTATKVAAAFFCLGASKATFKNNYSDSRVGGPRMVWIIFAIVLIVCAIGGLLNGDELIRESFRSNAREDGWYDVRRYIQFFCLVILIPIGARLYRYLKKLIGREVASANGILALHGMCLQVIVTVLLTVSWHYTDDILNLRLPGVSVGSALSLISIAMVIVAAIRDTIRLTQP